MKTQATAVMTMLLLAASGCAALGPQPSTGREARPIGLQRRLAVAAIDSLKKGDFEAAAKLAQQVARQDPHNSYARAIKAITGYKKAMRDLVGGFRIIVVGVLGSVMLNRFLGDRSGSLSGLDAADRLARTVLEAADKSLARVQDDLAAAAHPGFHLELCLACWNVDWTASGRITELDRHLLEIEFDAKGEELDAEDPRRRPTFRFDYGDVLWARALVSFQRALVHLVLAYRWTEAKRILDGLDKQRARIVFRLVDVARVVSAREQLRQGLALADKTRLAYLAETDDDREWVPNPRQRNHPLPLPVDQALYRTWAAVISDIRRLHRGQEGLGVADLAQLGDHKWKTPPGGYLNIDKMLNPPRDIVIEPDAKDLENPTHVEETLKAVFGDCYVQNMKASPLIRRLQRMKREMDAGKESFARKLRYLLWLN